MAAIKRPKVQEKSIQVLQYIINTIEIQLVGFSIDYFLGELSAEEYSLLETNLRADIQAYQVKIQQLQDQITSTINQEEVWND